MKLAKDMTLLVIALPLVLLPTWLFAFAFGALVLAAQ
jgi:hypothetical protein